MLRHLKRVFVSFSPYDAKATSARELLQRIGCDAARKSNPQCAVDFAVDEAAPDGGAFVELQFADGAEARLGTADLKVADIVRVIEAKSAEMELRAVLRDVGFDAAAAGAAAQAAKGGIGGSGGGSGGGKK